MAKPVKKPKNNDALKRKDEEQDITDAAEKILDHNENVILVAPLEDIFQNDILYHWNAFDSFDKTDELGQPLKFLFAASYNYVHHSEREHEIAHGAKVVFSDESCHVIFSEQDLFTIRDAPQGQFTVNTGVFNKRTKLAVPMPPQFDYKDITRGLKLMLERNSVEWDRRKEDSIISGIGAFKTLIFPKAKTYTLHHRTTAEQSWAFLLTDTLGLRFFLDSSGVISCFTSDIKITFLKNSKLPASFTKAVLFTQMYLNASSAISFFVQPTLRDVADYYETPSPDGFALELRDYQKRSLTWMLESETNNSRINLGGFVHFPEDDIVVDSVGAWSWSLSMEQYLSTGGVLADQTGVGKTVTMLALIKSNPLNNNTYLHGTRKIDNDSKFISSTLVICPANLVLQWFQEAKKCIPDVEAIQLYNKYDLQKIVQQEKEYQIIIIPFNALGDKKLPIDLSKLMFHRIVIDEIHELVRCSSATNLFITQVNAINANIVKLNASHFWGMTGTPSLDSVKEITHKSVLLGMNLNGLSSQSFINRCVTRNCPDLGLEPIIEEVIKVRLTPYERAVYQTKMSTADGSYEEAIMLCCHFDATDHQPADNKNVRETVSAKKVAEMLQKKKLDKIEEYENLVKVKQNKIEEYKSRIENIRQKRAMRTKQGNKKTSKDVEKKLEEDVRMEECHIKIRERESDIKYYSSKIEEFKMSFNFFDKVLEMLMKREEEECVTCWTKYDKDSTICMMPCSHLLCEDCLRSLVSKLCPYCRNPFRVENVYHVAPVHEEMSQEEEPEFQFTDKFKYGSKIQHLVKYLDKKINLDPSSKFIIFMQYKKLASLVSEALTCLDVVNVTVAGDVKERSETILKFKEDANIKSIILSSEDSVSGLNLVEADHVVIFHPFYYGRGTEEKAIAMEKQGIARAYRMGQTRPVNVVRFVAQGTVEERLTTERINRI